MTSAADSPPVVAPHTPPRPAFARFREGFGVPLEGLAYMNRQPRLWRYAVIPILLNVLITALVLVLLIGGAIWFSVKVHPRFPDTFWGTVLEIAAVLGALGLAVVVALVTWLLLNGILCGHYYAKLAREVELQLGTPPGHLREVPFRYQVADTIRDTAALLGISLGLLLLNVVPGIGSVVGFVLTIYFDSFILGRDYIDFPMSLRAIRRADKLAIARAHRPETVGLGSVVFLMTLVPVIGSIGLATAAAGSVLLYKRWRDAGEVATLPAGDLTLNAPRS